ncbi:kinase-like domain-containing protein [Aspergillus pseudodeflectus]|uniref:Kinase-like domain-containing protein n=1 Tax=Aspergillus pseudodeflectus TaxID=176178 RepID=A0ABR4J8R1_9EURO
MFVFEHFTGHLLTLVQKDLPLVVVKQILKNALTRLAELHDQDIVHTEYKMDNVCNMVGKQEGNWMWRSPEAHARGPVNKPSDIFSFALCIITLHKRIILAVREEELGEGVDPLAIVIERQISYFADEDGLYGALKHPGDNPWVQPFKYWKGVDDEFKDLVCAMTRFDLGNQITARQAFKHRVTNIS